MSSIKSETTSQNTISKSLKPNRKFTKSLVLASPEEQKLIVGELLYPAIESLYPESAKQISDVMAFAFHHSELVHMLNCRHLFNVRMEEALMVIDICKDFSHSNKVPQQLLIKRQPLNNLLKVRLLGVLQHHCPDIADIIANKLVSLENMAILHLLQCTDCRRIRIDEIRSQIFANSVKQSLTVKNGLKNVDKSIEILAGRHLIGEDLFSILDGDETLTDETLTDETIIDGKSPQIVTQGQGRKIFSELRSVPSTSKVHKTILIKELFPVIKSLYPNFYLKMLTAIKDLDNSELIHMLWCRAFLYLKLDKFLSLMKIFGESIYPTAEAKEFSFLKEETITHLHYPIGQFYID